MPRYSVRFGNYTGNPASSQDFTGDLAVDTYALSIENPVGSGNIAWALTPGGTAVGTGLGVTTNAGAITNGATLSPTAATYSVIRCAPAAAVTGIILAAGTFDQQLVYVLNEAAAANTITFAAAGTSHVADGATTAIAGVTGRLLIWDAAVSLWFKTGG